MPDTFTPEQISQILEEFFKVVGTRQYIGARYVPIFGRKDEETIEWDNTKTYEPLTVVLYQGNSYTSRQYVPVGVEITNQEFWAITGNYNAQIEQYRRDTAAAKAAADAAQNDIDTLLPKSDFSAETTVKKYIDDSVAEIQNDIDTLLPKADFSAENTVKDYVDAMTESLENNFGALLPSNAFSATETVKKYIDKAVGIIPIAKNLIQPIIIGNDYYPQDTYDSRGIQFASCVKHNNTVYGIFTKNSSTYDCVTRIYNIVTNSARTVDVVQNGHGNSMCYIDATDKILCVWLNMVSGNTYVDTPNVNIYDASFNLERTVQTARPYYGITYDSVTGKLYGMSHERLSEHILVIYELDVETYEEVSSFTLNMPVRYHGYTLQDFAANDGAFYINFSQNFLWIHNSDTDEHHVIDTEDIAHQYDVGESEGLEFDNTGNLINAFTFTLNGVDGGAAGSVGVLYNNDISSTVPVVSTSRTLTLSEEAKNQFYVYPWIIRNIAEVNNHIDPTWHIVRVSSDVENLNFHGITMLKPFNLFVTDNATFKVSPFVLNDDVTVRVDSGSTLQFVVDTNPSTGQLFGTIPLNIEWGSLCVNNRGRIITNNTNGLILLGYNKRPCIIGNNNNNDVTFFDAAGTITATQNTIYLGSGWHINAVTN